MNKAITFADKIDNIKIYFSAVLCIVGCISSLASYLHFENVHQNGIYTIAEITAITDRKYDNRGMTLTFGKAVYYDNSGQAHTYNGYLGYGMNIGEDVPILYHRDNPDEVLKNTGSSVWLAGTVVFGILAVPCTILSIISIKKLFPKSPRQKYDWDF